jgi:hypothetical protein
MVAAAVVVAVGLEGTELLSAVDGNGPSVVGGEAGWAAAAGPDFSADPADPLLRWDFWDALWSPRFSPRPLTIREAAELFFSFSGGIKLLPDVGLPSLLTTPGDLEPILRLLNLRLERQR